MKKTQIIIITIALILTLGCIATFAVLYFTTDIFKSDKELFYKYASQIDLKEFIDLESYKAHEERLKTEGHACEGEISIEFDKGEEVITESIKYNGYSDPVNKNDNYDIIINKDNEPLLKMNYLKNQDFYGLLFKDVVNQYVVFENNNLKEFASKMGIQDISEIPNKIEIAEEVEENHTNHEEINTILNRYLNIAIETIPEENYSKIKKQEIALGNDTVEVEGYQVELKTKDLQAILIKVLEQAKTDEKLFELLNNENITFEDYQVGIDNLLEEVSKEISNEENTNLITISVYKKGKETVKLALVIGVEEPKNEIEISVEKLQNVISLGYNYFTTTISGTTENKIVITRKTTSEEQENIEAVITQIEDGDVQTNNKIVLTRNGALTSDNVTFNLDMLLGIDMSLVSPTAENPSLKIGIENSINFAGVPKEGKFEQGNHLVINGLTPEQLTNLFTNLGSLLGEKLKNEMFISMLASNNALFETAQQTAQETQNALEQEQQLIEQIQEGNFEEYEQERDNLENYGVIIGPTQTQNSIE